MSKAPLGTPNNLNRFGKGSKSLNPYFKIGYDENLHGLPVKRAKCSKDCDGFIAPVDGLDKFCRYVDKLEGLFNKKTYSRSIVELTTASESATEEFSHFPVEALEKLMNELNKAHPLHKNQIEVFEKYGLNCDRFKNNKKPEIGSGALNVNKINERNERNNKGKRGSRFEQVNEELVRYQLSEGYKTWCLPKKLNIIKLAPQFSIKKEMLKQLKPSL